MIEKFTRGKQSVRLRDLADHGPQENIFAVDSLSLVIGNNGAGKTRLLDAMWNAIKGNPAADEEWNWEPHFHPGTCPSKGNVGVVFFSHSPNREPKGKGARWIDASPSKTARPSNEALFGYEDYVKDITSIDPRFEVSLRARPLRLLRDLLWMMLMSGLPLRHCSEDLNRSFAQLDFLYRQDAGDHPKPPPTGTLADLDRQLYAVTEGLMAELAGWLSAAELTVILLDLELVRRRGYAYQSKLKAAYESMFAPYPPWAPRTARTAARSAACCGRPTAKTSPPRHWSA